MISDIRKNDSVSVRLEKMDKANLQKFKKFAVSKLTEADKYVDASLINSLLNDSGMLKENSPELKVVEVKKTLKKPTEYAVIKFCSGNFKNITLKIQTRYLKMIKRKSGHQITNIFL